MKTIRTSMGTFSVPDLTESGIEWLTNIISQHRSHLIDCKINLLELYLEYRFNKKLNRAQLNGAKRNLIGLKNSGINPIVIESILDQVRRYSFIDLPNVIFYEEIDNRLKSFLGQIEIKYTSKRQTFSLKTLTI